MQEGLLKLEFYGDLVYKNSVIWLLGMFRTIASR